MQRCVITRNFSHVPVTLLRTECFYGVIRRSILSYHYLLLVSFSKEIDPQKLPPTERAAHALS